MRKELRGGRSRRLEPVAKEGLLEAILGSERLINKPRGKSIPARGNSQCRDSEAGVRNSERHIEDWSECRLGQAQGRSGRVSAQRRPYSFF